MSIVILKYSEAKSQSYTGLGSLEFFKDLPIALVSIFFAQHLNRYPATKSLSISLLIVALCCFSIPFLPHFWFVKIWFILIGIAFSIGKICVFSIIKSITTDEKSFASLMSSTEASFMLGIFLINMEFALIFNSSFSDSWNYGFWIIGLFAIIGSILLFLNPLVQTEQKQNVETVNIKEDKVQIKSMLGVFAIIFLIVFAEQIFNSWLPTYFSSQLKVSSFFALQASAFMALFSFLGRIIAGYRLKRTSPTKYFVTCCVLSIIFLILGFSYIKLFPGNALALVVIFPVFGVLISPLYPVINSVFITNRANSSVVTLASYIIIFSSLGSSFGSLSTSFLFQKNLGDKYLLFATIPLILALFFMIILLKGSKEKQTV